MIRRGLMVEQLVRKMIETGRVDRRYVCPKCGNRSMVKIRNPRRKWYILVCKICRTKRGPFPPMKRRLAV